MALKMYAALPKAPALLEPSDCLVSYTGHFCKGGGSYPSTKMKSVYSTADQTRCGKEKLKNDISSGFVHIDTSVLTE